MPKPRKYKLEESKFLNIGSEVRKLLASRGRGFESYDDILKRLVKQYRARLYK